VQKARKLIYKKHNYSNTWGAYQCYGDPWYTLVEKPKPEGSKKEYASEDEVLVDLFNIASKKINKSEDKKNMLEKADQVYGWASESNQATARVLEELANVCAGFDDLKKAIFYYDEMVKEEKAGYSVRALEQSFNTRIKQFVVEKELEKKKDEKVKPKPKERIIISDFEGLVKTAPTAERYNLLGSAYKRCAYVFEEFEPLLKKAADNYLEAFRIKENDVRKYTYPLVNVLQAQFFINTTEKPPGANAKDNPDQFVAALDWIIDSEQKLKRIGVENKDFWEDVAMINIMTTKLLYLKKTKEIKETAERIIEEYARLFNSSGTLQHLRSEIEQFDWLIRMFDRISKSDHRHIKGKALTEAKYAALIKIREKLTQLKNPKTEA